MHTQAQVEEALKGFTGNQAARVVTTRSGSLQVNIDKMGENKSEHSKQELLSAYTAALAKAGIVMVRLNARPNGKDAQGKTIFSSAWPGLQFPGEGSQDVENQVKLARENELLRAKLALAQRGLDPSILDAQPAETDYEIVDGEPTESDDIPY